MQRKVQHASCDECRRRKIRCTATGENSCSHCLSLNIACRHTLQRKKRGPPAGRPHLKSINIQTLTASILSSVPYIIPRDEAELRQILKELASYIRVLEKELAETSRNTSLGRLFQQEDNSEQSTSGDENVDEQADCERLKQLQHSHNRGHGLTSSIKLVKSAIEASKDNGVHQDTVPIFKRPLFWDIELQPARQISSEPQLEPLIFPPHDLLVDLIDFWLEKSNPFLPLLHRGTFEKSVASGLHHRDRHFGETVLAVCALASRYSNDSRKFNMYGSPSSVGFLWIQQVNPVPISFLEPPSIYQLQKLILYCMFMQTTSMPYPSWVLTGLGIRLLQDVGAHRKQSSLPTISGELWKRAFWVLHFLDLCYSIDMGRPCATTSADYDVEYPLEVDDEYWELPGEKAFKQPPGKPCRLTYWIYILKSVGILETIIRTMISVPRETSWRKCEPDISYRRQRTINEIHKALNDWLDAIPEQLKWDPHRSDDIWFHQSTILYMMYYFYRTFIHWSGLTNPESLEICVSTAHSSVYILEAHHKEGGVSLAYPLVLITFANAAIILLINIWRSKRLNLSLDVDLEMADVIKCLEHLKRLEPRLQLAGRLWDTVLNVIFISDLTDAYNLAMDKYKKEPAQAGSGVSSTDLGVSSSSFFGQDWDTRPVQDYGPSLREPNFSIPSTSNRHTLPAVDVIPFNLPSVHMSSHYADSSLQEFNITAENPQQPNAWTLHHSISNSIIREGDWADYMVQVDEVLKTLR